MQKLFNGDNVKARRIFKATLNNNNSQPSNNGSNNNNYISGAQNI